jgi:hypothetical protein
MGCARRARLGSAAALGALAMVASSLAVAGTPASATAPGPATATVVAVSTTVPVSTTASSTSTTTTTTPSTTTTTTEPPTTTTRPAPTTTTSPPPGAVQASSSKTPWALILLIIVLAVAIALVAILLRSRKKRGIEASWRRAVIPALTDARLARESLLTGNAASEDPELRAAVGIQVERAAVALEHTVQAAPDPAAGSTATSAAAALRGLAFAIEADRLLRHGTAAPSGAQLAQADDARRARGAELNTALARLSARIGPAHGPKAGG